VVETPAAAIKINNLADIYCGRDAGAKGPHPLMQRTSGFSVWPMARTGCGDPQAHSRDTGEGDPEKSPFAVGVPFAPASRDRHRNACPSIVHDFLS
jgi:hypothetical protein